MPRYDGEDPPVTLWLTNLCIHADNIRSPKVLTRSLSRHSLFKNSFVFKGQRELGTIKRLFKQNEIIAQLDGCAAALKTTLEIFMMEYGFGITSVLVDFRIDSERRHQELLELISSQSGSMDNASSFWFPFFTPRLPKDAPRRDSELKDLLDSLLCDPARVAILGPGGMGKTTLAMAALHDDAIIEKYNLRHFISCESSTNCGDLTVWTMLVVLDNFETPWEAVESRGPVEEFLSLLADIPSLALLVTVRGAERPGKVKWNRPFLSPLEPLSPSASRQIFVEVADEPGSGEELAFDHLLDLTGSLPLAVSLMANVASFEGYSSTLARWQTENTSLLSEGHDKRSNLEKSIAHSLSSPRISSSPHAKNLLSLLSLLPDGIRPQDILAGKVPFLIEATGDASLRWKYAGGTLRRSYYYKTPVPDGLIEGGVQYFKAGTRPVEEAVTFHNAVAWHYLTTGHKDLSKAIEFNQRAFALAEKAGDVDLQLQSLDTEFYTAHINQDPYRAIETAHKARDVAGFISSSPVGYPWIQREAWAQCWMGNLSRALELCTEAEQLLTSLGMEGSDWYLEILDVRADVGFRKSEYLEARQLHAQIVEKTSPTCSQWYHANSLCFIAQLDILMEGKVTDIVSNAKAAENVYVSFGSRRILFCSWLTAELKLQRGDIDSARADVLDCLSKSRGIYPDLPQFCLAALADPAHRMHGVMDTFRWAMISLAFVQKKKDPVGAVNALRSIADLYSIMYEEDTALNLFHAALEGGTKMDIHRLRAQCMVGIGDIMLRRGDPMQAREMWGAAQPLFIRSSRMKDAAAVEKRLQQLPPTQRDTSPSLQAIWDAKSTDSASINRVIADGYTPAMETGLEKLETLSAPTTSPSLHVETVVEPGILVNQHTKLPI
ncbi:hypothetical protein B0H13DRAFT_2501480 [Mycena leptocephala]|nr:hypothetical protein B0H13DRAFT_2501480 [Mycena leptocephala]